MTQKVTPKNFPKNDPKDDPKNNPKIDLQMTTKCPKMKCLKNVQNCLGIGQNLQMSHESYKRSFIL